MADYDLTVDDDQTDNVDESSELSGWVMEKVNRWRSTRDATYQSVWDQYEALWRGQWIGKLQQREQERSRLISPATQNAVDTTVAEMVEATFGRGVWFNIDDDNDQEKPVAEAARDLLLYNFQRDHVKSAVIEAYVNGAVKGTGIAKRILETKDDGSYCCYWEAIPPNNFVIDTAAKNVEEALGCAHETVRPLHEIKQKQQTGEYEKGEIGAMNGYVSNNLTINMAIDESDGVWITEYHGLVPRNMTSSKQDSPEESKYDDVLETPEDEMEEDDDLVEAVVTIANGGTVLKVEINTIERGVAAYPHDKIPAQFWGRGVCEKAFNAQTALDAEQRARIDAMALIAYPMFGFDATRLPRNLNLQVRPGKSFMTSGNPSEIIQALNLGHIEPSWFEHTGDLERQVQMATGTFDAASAIRSTTNNPTATGASMGFGSTIKRAKLTMMNVDEFLNAIVRKSYLAYQNYDPQRFPKNLEFSVNSTMSVIAREFEQTQMTNLLAIVPPESPAYLIILKAIMENYSGPSRMQAVQAIEQQMKPDPEQQKRQQQQQQAQFEGMLAEVEKLKAEIGKIGAETQFTNAKTKTEAVKANSEDEQLELDAHRIALEARQVQVQERQTDIAQQKVHVDKAKVMVDHFKAKNDANKPKASSSK